MSSWLLQHFLNPALVLPGLLLVALPIIIHLLHRLQYRRVKFAAMEFLLASQKRNRRRILIEQLLLLLARILLVLLLVLLVGRLILNPDELSLFQGAQAHHLVILDDSGSMRDRGPDGTAFEQAKQVLQRIVAEGARRPGTQKLTVLLMSAPDQSLAGLSERTIDQELLTEISSRLPLLQPTHQAFDPARAVEAAQLRLTEDRASVRQLHILSDFRAVDWQDNSPLATGLQELAAAKVGINLVRCITETHENLSLTELRGSVEIAAAGVPVSFYATVANRGTREVQDVRGQLFVDGVRLPRTLDFGTIAPGGTSERRFEVVFDSPKLHRLQVQLPEDAFEPDNVRFLAVSVPVENPVLIVDGSPAAEQAMYLADALAADKSVTGFAPAIHPPDDLRRLPLEQYHIIYVVNVGELAADAVAALQQYVAGGGGLVWYLGPSVNAVSYNTRLFEQTGLFPARLGLTPQLLPRIESGPLLPDIRVGSDPLFAFLAGEENPVIDTVFVNYSFPLETPATSADSLQPETEVLATLRDGRPLVLRHRLGQGRIVTCLTSAGPVRSDGLVWTNWANGPGKVSFVVFQLELARDVARRDRALPQYEVGQVLEERLNAAYFREDVEFFTPDERVLRFKAERIVPGAEEAAGDAAAAVEPLLLARFSETDLPGIYGVSRMTRQQEVEQSLYAFNVPAREGELALLDDPGVRRQLGEAPVEIQPAGDFSWIRAESPGADLRWLLIIGLLLLGMFEQALAYRVSYH
jgi:hypothetical protein